MLHQPPTQDAELVQRRRHRYPTANRGSPLFRQFHPRSATTKFLHRRQAVAVVEAVAVEGAALVAAWQCAYRPVAFGPCRPVVGFEEFNFGTSVLWWRVADVVVDGEERCGGGIKC